MDHAVVLAPMERKWVHACDGGSCNRYGGDEEGVVWNVHDSMNFN